MLLNPCRDYLFKKFLIILKLMCNFIFNRCIQLRIQQHTLNSLYNRNNFLNRCPIPRIDILTYFTCLPINIRMIDRSDKVYNRCLERILFRNVNVEGEYTLLVGTVHWTLHFHCPVV